MKTGPRAFGPATTTTRWQAREYEGATAWERPLQARPKGLKSLCLDRNDLDLNELDELLKLNRQTKQ